MVLTRDLVELSQPQPLRLVAEGVSVSRASTDERDYLMPLLTLEQVCSVLQLDARTIDKMDLPWVWVRPNKRRLPKTDLDEFIEKNRLKRHPSGVE